MGKKTKTVLKGFDYMHCDDFAAFLSEMATKGWHFKEWGVGLKFEKGEPENVTYAVEVFINASENDMRPEPHTEEFAEYCEAAGWKFVDAKQKFCIFKKVEENALELFTSVERVGNSFKGTLSGSNILLLGLYGLNAVLQWVNLNISFQNRIFSDSFWFSFVIWNAMFLAQVCIFIYAFVKKIKLQKRIKMGQDIYIGSWQNSKLRIGLRDIYIIFLLVILLSYLLMLGRTELAVLHIVIIGITFVFSALLAKIRPGNSANVVSQILFCIVLIMVIVIGLFTISEGEETEVGRDDLPLKISDYREFPDEIEDVSIHQDENVLGIQGSYFIFSKTDTVYYTIYKSKHAWILDKIWEEELSAWVNRDMADCTENWGAKKAFRNDVGTYYVRYQDAIFILREDAESSLTPEQMEIICEKLEMK